MVVERLELVLELGVVDGQLVEALTKTPPA
jgi:hypothetical protein